MASIDLTIRNKKKEAKRYEAYLKKLGKKKVEQKKGEQKKYLRKEWQRIFVIIFHQSTKMQIFRSCRKIMEFS